jgi:hypothetical protein
LKQDVVEGRKEYSHSRPRVAAAARAGAASADVLKAA